MLPMATAAALGSPGLLSSRTSFLLVPSPNATAMTVRLGRHGGVNRAVIIGVAPRSGPRDGEWGADPDPSTGTGRMVDEDMATLRRRVREARAALSDDDDIDGDDDAAGPVDGAGAAAPRTGVSGAACLLLEELLLNARPGLGAGVLAALLLLGVPASAFLVCAKLIPVVDAISSAVNGR